MTPHLVKWHEEFAGQGLTIIEIDNGLADTLSRLREHTGHLELPYAVLHDGAGDLCDAYNIGAYPTAYLIGADGRVLWEGHPNGTEGSRIAEAIDQAGARGKS